MKKWLLYNRNSIQFVQKRLTLNNILTTRFLSTISEDSRIDILTNVGNIEKVWNDGSIKQAISLSKNNLETIDELTRRNNDYDAFSMQFLSSTRYKILELRANMLFMTNGFAEAEAIYQEMLSLQMMEYESWIEEQKKYRNAQFQRARVQLIIRLAECMRRNNKFDEAIKLLLRTCEELSEEIALIICLRERLGWSYYQQGMEYSIAQKQKKDKFSRYNDMEKAHSLFIQAINHLNVASALGQQVGVENNYLEFTTDDEKNLVDVMMDRALVYKALGELEVTKEESNKYYLSAAKDFANIIEKDATNYIAYFLCAECCAKADNHDQAISMYDNFLENLHDYVKQERSKGNSYIRPEELYIETRIKRALCAIKITDFPLAQDDLQEVVNLITDLLSHNEQSKMDRNLLLHYKAIAHNKLGYCFYRRYRYHDAIEQNTLALKVEPTFMEAYRDRCECYECLSLDKEADEDRRMVEYLKRKMAVEQ